MLEQSCLNWVEGVQWKHLAVHSWSGWLLLPGKTRGTLETKGVDTFISCKHHRRWELCTTTQCTWLPFRVTPDDCVCYCSCRESANICNLRFNKLIGLADTCTFLPVNLSSAFKYDCSGTAQARFWSHLHLCQCGVTPLMPKCGSKSCPAVAWAEVSLMSSMRKSCIQTVFPTVNCA